MWWILKNLDDLMILAATFVHKQDATCIYSSGNSLFFFAYLGRLGLVLVQFGCLFEF